jgi:hypothetical protein
MRSNKVAEAVVDLSAATGAVYTYQTIGDGYVEVAQIVGTFEEAVAGGGFSTTAGIVTVQANPGSGAVALGTFTTGTPATARAIGDSLQITVDSTNAPQGIYHFTAGTDLIVNLTTQGTGGTTTGTLRVTIPVEEDLG